MKPFGCSELPTIQGVVCDNELTYIRIMKHISIIVPKGAILGSLEGPRLLFSEVNELLKRIGKMPLFKVQLVGLMKETPVYNGIYNVYADELIKNIDKTDLIIIPALDGNLQQNVENNKDFIPWIIKQHSNGAEVASLCVGAFLLASTGLINGKQCATHWMAANDFRKMFPEVTLVEDKIITDENGIYSSGGAFSYLNLILYLIEKYAGRDVAVFCSKAFQIDIDRNSQSPFIMFKGQKDHEDEPINSFSRLLKNQRPHLHVPPALFLQDQLMKVFFLRK